MYDERRKLIAVVCSAPALMPQLWMWWVSMRPALARHATISSASRKSSCSVRWLTTNHSNMPAVGSDDGAAITPPPAMNAASVAAPNEKLASLGLLPVACQ